MKYSIKYFSRNFAKKSANIRKSDNITEDHKIIEEQKNDQLLVNEVLNNQDESGKYFNNLRKANDSNVFTQDKNERLIQKLLYQSIVVYGQMNSYCK